MGNQQRFYSGSLEFDLYVTDGEIYGSPDVLLAGADLTLVIELEPDPISAWTSYTVRLDASAGWRVSNAVTGPLATNRQIRNVLRDLNVLLIRGEHVVGRDTGQLDNVRIVQRGHK